MPTALILTDVEKVSLRYGTPQACCIDALSVAEAERYLGEGHFLKGRWARRWRHACVS